MRAVNLAPLYRNTVGYDQLASMLGNAFQPEQTTPSYPPYDIIAVDENTYAIRLAIAGFEESDLDIQVDRGILSIRGKKSEDNSSPNYLYKGIASRGFERKFNLATHVEVTSAVLKNGLLTINLKHEIPEAMKPKRISINTAENTLTRDNLKIHAA